MSDHDQTFTSCCLGSHNLQCEFSRIDAQNFLRCRQIQNAPLLSSLLAGFSDAVVTWPCDVIAVSHLLDTKFNSYLQLELRRQNVRYAGHHKTMANFKPVVYVHKRCWSKYSVSGWDCWVRLRLHSVWSRLRLGPTIKLLDTVPRDTTYSTPL